MKRKAKTPKAPGFTRAIVAANLTALLNHHYKQHPNVTLRQKALEHDSGVRSSTIQRLMKEEVGANLETLELLAAPFNLSVYQLLAPNLDVGNPQMIKGALKEEQRLYANFRKARVSRRKDFVLEDVPEAQSAQRQRVMP